MKCSLIDNLTAAFSTAQHWGCEFDSRWKYGCIFTSFCIMLSRIYRGLGMDKPLRAIIMPIITC